MWDTLKAEDDKLEAQPNGKICPSDFDEFKLTFIRRMFNASEMMKTLKQHFTMSYNGRHRHSGTMYEFVYGEAVGMKSHHRLTTAYIKPLLDMKLIEQTIPNSPRAPNQKYRLAS